MLMKFLDQIDNYSPTSLAIVLQSWDTQFVGADNLGLLCKVIDPLWELLEGSAMARGNDGTVSSLLHSLHDTLVRACRSCMMSTAASTFKASAADQRRKAIADALALVHKAPPRGILGVTCQAIVLLSQAHIVGVLSVPSSKLWHGCITRLFGCFRSSSLHRGSPSRTNSWTQFLESLFSTTWPNWPVKHVQCANSCMMIC